MSSHNCVTCHFVIVFFFFRLVSIFVFLFNLVSIFVKINQFCSFQIDTKFNIFYTNYINTFSKIDIFINYFLNSIINY